jgi:hypothetical protein
MQSKKRSFVMASVLTIGGYIKNVSAQLIVFHILGLPFDLQRCMIIGGALSCLSVFWNFFIIRCFDNKDDKNA